MGSLNLCFGGAPLLRLLPGLLHSLKSDTWMIIYRASLLVMSYHMTNLSPGCVLTQTLSNLSFFLSFFLRLGRTAVLANGNKAAHIEQEMAVLEVSGVFSSAIGLTQRLSFNSPAGVSLPADVNRHTLLREQYVFTVIAILPRDCRAPPLVG